MAYHIRIIDKNKERDAFRRLFQTVFHHQMTAKLWEWKYLENPMTLDQPLIYIAEHEGEIVGARPILPNRMKFGDNILKVAQPCDTMVHPEHRRKGIFAKMTNFAIIDAQKRGFSLFYGFPNLLLGKIYKNVKSLGWEVISKIDASYKIFSPSKVISTTMPENILSSIGKIFFRFLSSKKCKLPSLKPAKSYDINVESTIANEIENLWQGLSVNYKISTVRDEKYVKWRFIKHPENNYKFLSARKSKELLGYFVFNIVKNDKLIEGRIVDYGIKENSKDVFLALLLEALNNFKNDECNLVSTWAFTQPQFQQVLDRCGFIRKLSFPYKIFTETSYFVANKIVSNNLPIYPMDKKHWYITQSDTDTY